MNLSRRTRRVLFVIALIALVCAGVFGTGRVHLAVAQDAPAAQSGPTTPDTPNVPDIDLPLPNVIVNTTDLTAAIDGKCDLWEALQAVFQANYGLSPTYHECTAKVGGMNIIAFSVIGGTITVPASGSYSDLPFVHGETVILGPITIAGAGSSA
ncbi:MAG: hypothetical protein HY870_12690, partial [Chloroflexi bacterium]|nr:hypothetical protein [Chloroflexota bacterium]